MERSSEPDFVFKVLRTVWYPACRAWSAYCSQNIDISFDDSIMGQFRLGIPLQIYDAYERYSQSSGTNFKKQDDLFGATLDSIANVEIRSFCLAMDKSSDQSQGYALQAIQKTLEALIHLVSRSNVDGVVSRPVQGSVGKIDDVAEIPFCKGALLLQGRIIRLMDIALDQQASLLTCKYCYMDIGKLPSIGDGLVFKYWDQIASCHVTACMSFSDRRAAYRCIFCHEDGFDFFTLSGQEMAEHLNSCVAHRSSTTSTPNRSSTNLPLDSQRTIVQTANNGLPARETPRKGPTITTTTRDASFANSSNSPAEGSRFASPLVGGRSNDQSRPPQPARVAAPERDRQIMAGTEITPNVAPKPSTITTGRVQTSSVANTRHEVARESFDNSLPDYNKPPSYNYIHPPPSPPRIETSLPSRPPPHYSDPSIPRNPPQRQVPRKAVLPSNQSSNTSPSDIMYTPDSQPSPSRATPKRSTPEESAVRVLRDMGVSDLQARTLLDTTGGDIQQAAELYLTSEEANLSLPTRQNLDSPRSPSTSASMANHVLSPRPQRRRGGPFG